MPSSEIATDSLAITLFGPMQVRVQGILLPPFRSRKALWLLALLTLRHERPVEREWLAGTLWPDLDQSQSFANLRPVLSELRRALATQGKRLQSPDRHTLVLELQDADVDVLRFDAAITSGKLSDLERAVTLYSGLLLEGCSEEWVFQERVLREQNCLQALQKLGDAALTGGDYDAAGGYYRRAVRLDPWQEAARRGWMEALAKKGDTNAALQVYREYVAFLKDDPHAAPDEQTSALYQRLRAEVRQRVSSHAVVVVNETAFPKVTGYLPQPLTDLVGREDERIEVALRLRRSRLVTLTGLGGIGKTRLAREVAGEVVGEYADGVWLVALEALSEGRLVVQQIASVLGFEAEPGRTPLQSVTEHLRTKRLLLVLDNCEHLLEASVQVVAHLLQACAEVRILATSREALGITGETVWAVPSLTTPDPAHLPQPQATLLRVLMGYESVQLFVERAQAVQKTFLLTKSNARMVAEVCFRLEGIPLAIELAAARIKAMTVDQIAARLDNELSLLTGGSRTAQSRQQTLRGTLDWSYALLSRPEQVLLHRVSVFAGGWTLEAAEAICIGREIEARKVLDLLAALADKSLVAFEDRELEGEGRYRLLEVVRQYAGEKLREAEGTDKIETKHRDWFVAFSERAEPELKGAEQTVWLERLVTEYDNLRIVMARCREDVSGIEAGLRLTGALWRFWNLRGDHFEGRRQLEAALARDRTQVPTRERAKALQGLGFILERQGEHPLAREYQEQALHIREQIGDRRGIGDSLFALGNAACLLGDFDTGRAFYERSMAIRREFGDRHGIAVTLNSLGWAALRRSDYVEGKSRYEESLAIFRELGDKAKIAWVLNYLGIIASQDGDYMMAQTYLEESLPLVEELGDKRGKAWALYAFAGVDHARMRYDAAQARYQASLSLLREFGDRDGIAGISRSLGEVALDQGNPKAAHTWLIEGLRIYREVGDKAGIANILRGLGVLARREGNFGSARALLEESLRDLHELGEKQGVALCLEEWAGLRLEESEIEAVVRLLGAAHRLRENLGFPASPNRQAKLDTLIEQARIILGVSAFAATWEEGHAMTWEQAVAYAMKQDESSSKKRVDDTLV